MPSESAKSGLKELRASAAVTSDYVASTNELNIETARTIHLVVKVTAGATGDQVSIVPQGSFDEPTKPGPGWYLFPSSDGSVTEVDLAGSLPAGSAFTGEDFGSQVVYSLELRTPAADGNTQVQLLSYYLNAGAFRRLRVLVKGVSGTPTVAVSAAKAT